MSDDELAAVAAALTAYTQTNEEPAQPQPSAWKRAARREALDDGVY